MENRIQDWALAIQRHEGFYPGSASHRNNNPGNFRCSPLIMGELGATKCVNNLAIFPTYEKGFAALKQFLTYACTDKLRSYQSAMTLLQFYKVYAPSADKNNPLGYAIAIAKDLGISINTKIKDLLNGDMVVVQQPTTTNTMIKIENQLDKKWAKYYMGFARGYSFAGNACFLFCFTFMHSVKMGKQISPAVVDQMFIDGGVYSGPLINSEKAAKVLGLQYFGKETNINNTPDWSPSIKEVDFSIAGGKQQHFVIRINDESGKYILDPYQGVKRAINFYELKVKSPNWETGNFSYRKFKI